MWSPCLHFCDWANPHQAWDAYMSLLRTLERKTSCSSSTCMPWALSRLSAYVRVGRYINTKKDRKDTEKDRKARNNLLFSKKEGKCSRRNQRSFWVKRGTIFGNLCGVIACFSDNYTVATLVAGVCGCSNTRTLKKLTHTICPDPRSFFRSGGGGGLIS